MAITQQEKYEAYLPNQASLGVIKLMEKSVTIDGKITRRKYYDNYSFNIYYVVDDYLKVLVEDTTPEYGITTYTTGDEVQVNEIGLKFKYSGVDDLLVDANNFNEKHPLAKDDNNLYKNRDFWVVIGVVDELKPFDGSSKSSLYSHEFDILVERKPVVGRPANDGTSMNVFFSGGNCEIKTYGNRISYPVCLGGYDENGDLYDEGEFEISMPCFDQNGNTTDFMINHNYEEYLAHHSTHENTDRISIKDILYPTNNGHDTVHKVEATFKSAPENFLINDMLFVHHGHVGISSICFVTWHSLGSKLIGHTSNRVSEFKTLMSDGVEKQIVSKSYDVFSGHILIDKENLKKTEYLLMKATKGDYVFHIGAGELHDNRVYLAKLKYSSPIENNSKYKISISGQSLSYDVSNPLVNADSTEGYPV